ncbi:TPA: chromosomal replication initiator protein DnaA [Candidatus Poribacteria bacterium]|nr:chromosomal replication initiator protein DnaA [Candidatus Poribacteria bacterium]
MEEGGDIYLHLVKPLEVTEDSFVLSVPAEYVQNIVQERYLSRIGDIASKEVGRPVNIQFVVERSDVGEGQRSPIYDHTLVIPARRVERRFTSNLNAKYTFERFVVGTSNKIAYEAAMAVAENPNGRTFNPLFIYGGVGLGKTHLLQAIGNYVVQHHPNMKVLYVTSEMFMNDYIEAIQTQNSLSLREKYRTLDILLIDDVQSLQDKEGTQEEFFNTFNDLYNANKQIVLSSDSPPSRITSIPDRLRSRFQMGLVTYIRPPEFETRVAILRKKSEELEIKNMPDDVVFFIAETIRTNIRELEGALLRVASYASFSESEITLDLAKEVLKDVSEPPPVEKWEPVTISSIQKAVASFFKISVSDLKSEKRNKSIAWPRHIAMYLCRQLTNASLEDIGGSFGGRDHSTVLHAINKIEEKIQVDRDLSQTVNQLMEILRR